MTYIVQSGSLQYMVEQGDLVPVQLIDIPVGETTELKVLASFENGKASVKTGTIKAKVVEQYRDDKVRVVKYKAKSKYHKQSGHRQYKTLLQIL